MTSGAVDVTMALLHASLWSPAGLVEEAVEKSSLPRRWSVRSRLVLRVTAEDDGRLFSCEAAHPAIRGDTAPPLASVTLSVLRE